MVYNFVAVEGISNLLKDATPQPLRDFIFGRNIQTYGDPLGPTFDWLIESNKTFEQIIAGASRPNPNIDNVLSPFEAWLRSR